MAEVIGVVASGISIATLAAQIAGSIVKLKSYWNEVKDAPEDIWLLMEELEGFKTLFSIIQGNLQRDSISNTTAASISASECLDNCQKGAKRLQKLTNDLYTDINASRGTKLRWVSAKVVMKKDKIKRYKSRLKSSIGLLSLSYQSYNTWAPSSLVNFFVTSSVPDSTFKQYSCLCGALISIRRPFYITRYMLVMICLIQKGKLIPVVNVKW